MSQQNIKWPSTRIAQGGLFHSAKMQYSKETAELLKVLMEESKLSMQIRKKINYHLRNGSALPPPPPPQNLTQRKDMDDNTKALQIMRSARAAKRKSLNDILASGAYDVQRYRPLPDGRLSSNAAKIKLQEVMSGLKHTDGCLKAKKRPVITEEEDYEPEDLVNELLDQISERADWLAEMEALGEGKKYRSDIQLQITERLRKIKGLEKQIELKKQGCIFVK